MTPITTVPHLAALLRAARTVADMSRQDVADALGVHRGTVDAWEQGRHMPDVGRLLSWADLVGVELHASIRPPRDAR